MDTKDLLREVIDERLKGLKTMKEGSEEFNNEVTAINKLLDQYNDMHRVENERLKLDNEYSSISVENDRVQSEKADRKVKNIIAGVGLGITAVGFYLSLMFEEHGSVTSDAGRKIYNQIFRIKQN